MIHRQSRNRLAEALRHYASGQLLNDDLDDVVVNSEDRGAIAVKQMAWGLYDDLFQHRATGPHYLGPGDRHEVARWILFLYSELEYAWPHFSFVQTVNWPLNLLTFGWWEEKKRRRFVDFREAGDFSFWPFVSRADFDGARRQVRPFA